MINQIDKNKIRLRRHIRVRRKISGTAETPRLCVFRSNKHIEAQIIDDVAAKTLVSASSLALHLANGSNVDAATLVGEEIAKKAVAAGISKVVFDRGGYIYHGRVQALAEGARKGGLTF
ncbi:MAG: 50S ribosomal protein L18 [Bacilli bacterium]|jgi:large subunit ribosomal protein L18|nr:50S ribosomal protein L18 [Bacilli bacterium]MDD3388970.1 50S ribosomal protein L18 [Bacilli bacterium]MDD4344409.1 50S ribosomal protein L18 [Bacilli bacterium]MDD4520687.1 50S ribosomal protein L18 [Bacilli bacterium]MDY0399338.1 50S ribosomal protein L18 [Bacilli bacterium]